jgi:hypothetical protein
VQKNFNCLISVLLHTYKLNFIKEQNPLMNEKENTASAILLIEQDDETRPLLVRNLSNAGYQVIVALDEEGAIERTIGGLPSL